MEFRVDLDSYRGPLDLLLYLVRKHEVEVLDIPIATLTQQYLAYLEVLEALDVNAVGEFLEMASTLVEIKSRQVLPQTESDDGSDSVSISVATSSIDRGYRLCSVASSLLSGS